MWAYSLASGCRERILVSENSDVTDTILQDETDLKTTQALGSGSTLPPPPRSPRLSSGEEARLELCRTYRRCAHGLISWSDGCKAGFLLNSIHKIFVGEDLAALNARLAALEARVP